MVKPRKNSSKKSSNLPTASLAPVKEAILKTFKKQLKGKKLNLMGNIYSDEIVVCITVVDKDSIKPINFEASVDYSAKKNDAVDQMGAALDALGSMIQQYFDADGDIEFPSDWQEFDLEDKKVFLKTSSENYDLEDLADKFLK